LDALIGGVSAWAPLHDVQDWLVLALKPPLGQISVMANFPIPLTAFQERALSRLRGFADGTLLSTPAVSQHPYVRPVAGEANQYLVIEWSQTLKVYLYDTEVGFDGFTLEREDFQTDDAQIAGMIDEIEYRLANVG